MSNRKSSWSLLGLLLLLFLGCDGTTDLEYCGAVNPAGFEIVVGEEVIFQWRDCRLTSLAVYGDGIQLWAIGGKFKSPVTYGIAPPGASSLTDVGHLVPGQTYEVLVVSGSWAKWYDFVR